MHSENGRVRFVEIAATEKVTHRTKLIATGTVERLSEDSLYGLAQFVWYAVLDIAGTCDSAMALQVDQKDGTSCCDQGAAPSCQATEAGFARTIQVKYVDDGG